MITKRLICKWGQSDNIGNGFANYMYVVESSRKKIRLASEFRPNIYFFKVMLFKLFALNSNRTFKNSSTIRPFKKCEANFFSIIP